MPKKQQNCEESAFSRIFSIFLFPKFLLYQDRLKKIYISKIENRCRIFRWIDSNCQKWDCKISRGIRKWTKNKHKKWGKARKSKKSLKTRFSRYRSIYIFFRTDVKCIIYTSKTLFFGFSLIFWLSLIFCAYSEFIFGFHEKFYTDIVPWKFFVILWLNG